MEKIQWYIPFSTIPNSNWQLSNGISPLVTGWKVELTSHHPTCKAVIWLCRSPESLALSQQVCHGCHAAVQTSYSNIQDVCFNMWTKALATMFWLAVKDSYHTTGTSNASKWIGHKKTYNNGCSTSRRCDGLVSLASRTTRTLRPHHHELHETLNTTCLMSKNPGKKKQKLYKS